MKLIQGLMSFALMGMAVNGSILRKDPPCASQEIDTVTSSRWVQQLVKSLPQEITMYPCALSCLIDPRKFIIDIWQR
jgi:hypothetical protein